MLRTVLKKSEHRTLQNSIWVAIYLPSRKPSKGGKQDMLSTEEEMKTKSWATFYNEPLHMDIPVLAN